MNQMYIFLLFSVLLSSACSRPVIDNPPQPSEPETEEMQEAYKEKVRTMPYPKMSNELFVNPPALIVPEAMKTSEGLLFELSRSEDFEGGDVVRSGVVEWCMYNPHRELEPGIWYWRFRCVDNSGNGGTWSAPISFEVLAETPVFVTPEFSAFADGLPAGGTHPRLYPFISEEELEAAKGNVKSHPEYKSLLSRAQTGADAEYTPETMYGTTKKTDMVRNNSTNLYSAFLLTGNSAYSAGLRKILKAYIDNPPDDRQLFGANFDATNLGIGCIKIYDALYGSLSAGEKTAMEDMMYRIADYYFDRVKGKEENQMFDNHFWQQNYRVYFVLAYMLYDVGRYSAAAMEMMEYYYELWTARAPASGYNRDGMWHNGTGYFSANVKTLFYMPMFLGHCAKADFLQHPWYLNAGRSIMYSFPPGSKTNGFGDQSEKYDEQRIVVAFADFLAKELGDPCAGWYAKTCGTTLLTDYSLRFYRICSSGTEYSGALPEDLTKMLWYKDIGEVAMHTDISSTANDLALSFRSGTYGSGSHTLSNQNAFNILYKGQNVYRSSGYYQNFSDAHNLMSYRHTRAHNTILIDGIGQPFSTHAYGNVARALIGDNITYCLGDASRAYCGTTDEKMWTDAFKKAGITQTPENGFGETPLTKYRRHVLMLHPDGGGKPSDAIVVVYDELEASSGADWEWLLHSPYKDAGFVIRNSRESAYNEFLTENDGYVARTTLCSGTGFSVSKTNAFRVPPASAAESQWHLSAKVKDENALRFLAFIQVGDSAGDLPVVTKSGEKYKIGEWTIDAELDPSAAPRLNVSGPRAVFSFDREHPSADGVTHERQYAGSSWLYDTVDGMTKVQEMTDVLPPDTRSK